MGVPFFTLTLMVSSFLETPGLTRARFSGPNYQAASKYLTVLVPARARTRQRKHAACA
jgi:hypothetical protein